MKMKMKIKIENLKAKVSLLLLLMITSNQALAGPISNAVTKVGELVGVSQDVFVKAIALIGLIFFAVAFMQWRKLSSGAQGGGTPATAGGIIVGFVSGIGMATMPWWISAGQQELGVTGAIQNNIEIVKTQQVAYIDTGYIVNKTS
jgi:hypothetical protein